MILAGDVGGTKVHLALYNFEAGRLKPVRDEKFPARDFAMLDDVVKRFLAAGDGHPAADVKDIAAACFGCPGPVRNGRLKLTNLPWTLDARDLQRLARNRAHLPHQRPRSQRAMASRSSRPTPFIPCTRAIPPRLAIAAWSPPAPAWARPCSSGTASTITCPSPVEGGHSRLRRTQRPRSRAAAISAQDPQRTRLLRARGLRSSESRTCMRSFATTRRWKSRNGCATASPTKTPTQ